MRRLILTLISLLPIFGTALYFVSIPNDRIPQPFRVALLTVILGIIFAMSLYHFYLYAFTAKEPAYLIYSVFTLLVTVRFATAPGGFVEIVVPEHTTAIYHLSEVLLVVFTIFGMWFAHAALGIKWGGLPTRIVYIVTLGLPLVMAVITGRTVGTWWISLGVVPHIFILVKGFRSKHCRANPYVIFFLCVEFVFFIYPFLMLIPVMRMLYMPIVPLWLLFTLVQAVLLSQSYGEAKQREKELTEEKILLESLNRTKSEFFGNVSHEMKTPLTIIVTDMELAEQFIDEGNLEAAKELLHEVCQKAMQTADIVTDALAFTRGQETAKSMEPFDFGDVIKTTLAVFEPLIKKQGNMLVQDIEGLPPLDGNASMLADVLINLLFNANRHTQGGIINVKWKMKSGKQCLSVCDNGSGISPELLPRVFERGVTDGTGTGLGLAIVKRVMELHGGEASIKSEVGKGTTVTLVFPPLTEEKI